MPSRQRLTRSQRRQRKVAGYASRALGVAAAAGAGGRRRGRRGVAYDYRGGFGYERLGPSGSSVIGHTISMRRAPARSRHPPLN